MKRAFQIVLVVSNLVPLILGVAVAINGASFLLPDQLVDTSAAAQIRVYAIWFTAIFFLSVWIAFNVETSGPVLRIVFGLVALAGLSRLVTMASLGDFPTPTLIAAIIEIATVLFIPWHSYLLRTRKLDDDQSSNGGNEVAA